MQKVADLVLVLVSTKPDDADSVFENRYVYVDWARVLLQSMPTATLKRQHLF